VSDFLIPTPKGKKWGKQKGKNEFSNKFSKLKKVGKTKEEKRIFKQIFEIENFPH